MFGISTSPSRPELLARLVHHRRRRRRQRGVYQVSGTIGQPDAGPVMKSANFSLIGGFWSLLSAVQMTGAPLLTIWPAATNTVIVSWPSLSAGFILQQNTNGIASPNWSNVSVTITDNGTVKTLVVSPPGGSRFYRLFKP